MSSWKKKLRPASFRGVKFNVKSSDSPRGNRIDTHEFPGRKTPYSNNMGNKAREYSFEAFVLGNDYIDQKNKLLDALEEMNAGVLIHPYFGKLLVQAVDFPVRESNEDGGMAIFSLSFVEAGENIYPKVSVDTGFNLLNQALDVSNNADTYFLDRYNVVGLTASKINDINDTLTDFSDKIDKVSSVANLPELAMAVNDFKTNIADLIKKPVDIATKTTNMFTLLKDSANPSQVIKAMKTLLSFSYDTNDNTAVFSTYIKSQSMASASSISNDVDFNNLREAESLRNEFVDAVNAQLDNDDLNMALYDSLTSLKARIYDAIPGNRKLANIVKISLKSEIPSIVLCYDLYGNLDNEDTILSLNSTVNPFFVSNDKEVEVPEFAA